MNNHSSQETHGTNAHLILQPLALKATLVTLPTEIACKTILGYMKLGSISNQLLASRLKFLYTSLIKQHNDKPLHQNICLSRLI